MEQEVKLAFDSIEAARHAVHTAGGRLDVSRRLLDDQLFDTPDGRLRAAGAALRVRRDGTRGFLTFKGPIVPGPVKSREEIETLVGDAAVAEAVVRRLGFVAVYRGQKYREEFGLDAAKIMIDETPMGVFVEIEGAPDEIARATARLGRSTADYNLKSYPALWRAWCQHTGHGAPAAMLFDPPMA